MTDLVRIPQRRAAHAPSAPCIADDERALDNEAFAEAVRRAGGVLAQHGVGDGDVVAVMLPNRVELIVAMFAAWQLGAALTPINPDLTDTEATFQIEDSAAVVVIGDPGRAVVTLDVAALGGSAEPDGPAAPGIDPVEHNSARLALIIYTSGTTGVPKGVMLDHANVEAMVTQMVEAVGFDDSEHSLLVLPLFHVNGIVVSIVTPLSVGGQATIAGRFSPSTFFDIVGRVRPTYFSAVPAIYAMLSALPDTVVPDTSSIRRAICGAAPMPAELIGRFEERFGITIVEGYGLSEGTCASTLNPPDGPRKPGTVGVAMPGQQVRVVDAEGNDVAQGEAGEVVIAGPNVMRGYLNRPAATAETIVDGWLHTGDVGRFDEDGYLVLVDRIKDMIIRGGENLYPKEIENALHAHEAVLEAAVIGTPDPVMGEVPVAHVALRPGFTATEADLLEHCESRLARQKRPASIVIDAALPKNPVGKLDKPALRQRYR